ncbi:hypothetical protein [Cellulomonas chitinilytica]|uniref:hypothetical protein n=1 Tax=Cellulomonas chitinilytica TaxID=398759 RepID=UPI0019459932|nr:hypothetical protein [Cellulomonas chitinilytica]
MRGIPDDRLLAGEAVPGEPELTAFVAALRATADCEPPAPDDRLRALFAGGLVPATAARADEDVIAAGPVAPSAAPGVDGGPAGADERGAVVDELAARRRVGLLRRAAAVVGTSVALKVVIVTGAAAVGIVGAATVPGVPDVVRAPARAVLGVVLDEWHAVTDTTPATPDGCGTCDGNGRPAGRPDSGTADGSPGRPWSGEGPGTDGVRGVTWWHAGAPEAWRDAGTGASDRSAWRTDAWSDGTDRYRDRWTGGLSGAYGGGDRFGTWTSGTTTDGRWTDGTWTDGTWNYGTWTGETRTDGTPVDGTRTEGTQIGIDPRHSGGMPVRPGATPGGTGGATAGQRDGGAAAGGGAAARRGGAAGGAGGSGGTGQSGSGQSAGGQGTGADGQDAGGQGAAGQGAAGASTGQRGGGGAAGSADGTPVGGGAGGAGAAGRDAGGAGAGGADAGGGSDRGGQGPGGDGRP